MPHFGVFVSGSTSSVEDWQRAKNAPKADLPRLNEEQKEIARKMGMSEDEYARGVLVLQYGENRQRERGKVLGERIEEVLEDLGAPYKLDALMREGVKFRWLARIETPRGLRNVAIGMELADDVVDSAAVQDLNRLKALVLEALDRRDLAGNLR